MVGADLRGYPGAPIVLRLTRNRVVAVLCSAAALFGLWIVATGEAADQESAISFAILGGLAAVAAVRLFLARVVLTPEEVVDHGYFRSRRVRAGQFVAVIVTNSFMYGDVPTLVLADRRLVRLSSLGSSRGPLLPSSTRVPRQAAEIAVRYGLSPAHAAPKHRA